MQVVVVLQECLYFGLPVVDKDDEVGEVVLDVLGELEEAVERVFSQEGQLVYVLLVVFYISL